MSTGEKLPMILFVLDNYASFRDKMYRTEDALLAVISAARSCGIYLIVTGNSKGAIYYKVTEQIASRVVLNMNDSGAFRDILNVNIPITPEQTRGRALTLIDKKAVEVQFAIPLDTESEAVRTAKIHAIYTQMREGTAKAEYDLASSAPVITQEEEISDAPVIAYDAKINPLAPIGDADALVLGCDAETGELTGFELIDGFKAFIGKSSKELAVRIANEYAKESDRRVCFISSQENVQLDEKVLFVDDLDAFVTELVTAPEDEQKNTLVFIDSFCDFFDRISDDALAVLENALKVEKILNIVTFDAMERLSDYRDTGLYVHLVRCERGAIVGGCIDDSVSPAICNDIYEIPKKFREKALTETEAIVYNKDSMAYVTLKGAMGND